jgi:hypothetical protein
MVALTMIPPETKSPPPKPNAELLCASVLLMIVTAVDSDRRPPP